MYINLFIILVVWYDTCMQKHKHSKADLEDIWHEVPPDYYQNGVKRNLLQWMWHSGKVKKITSLIKSVNEKPKNILDVGCASGWFLSQIHLFFPNTDCTGIDVYTDAIKYGKSLYKHLKLFAGDGHTLPFKKNSFDIVICNEVLEHVVDPEKVLQEIKRVLSANGYAVIEMDTGNFLFRFVWYFWTHARHGVWEHAHIQVFNTRILENLIRENGFTIIKKNVFNNSMAVAFLVKKQS